MVSCQYSFLCSVQLVSRHVIKNSGDRFKKFRTELWRVVGLHQILAGNVITCFSGTTTIKSKPFHVWKEIFFLDLGLTVTEKKYRNKT